MGWRPRLNIVCNRCGKPSGVLRHVCVSNRKTKQTLKLKLSFGTCPKCRRPYSGDPVRHVCAPKSDFKKRKKAFDAEQAKKAREQARKNRPKHDYTECSDAECKRSLCAAYKAGRELGDQEGYQRGWQQGYGRGFPDGQAACPREHK